MGRAGGEPSNREQKGQGIPRSRPSACRWGAPGFPRRPVRGARGAADPPAPQSGSRRGKQVGVQPGPGSWERRARGRSGKRPPRCGRRPLARAPCSGALSQLERIQFPRRQAEPGRPRRCPAGRAAPPPRPPPTSRAASAQEEEEKEAAAAVALTRGCAERGRRRSARRGGRGPVCAPKPAPPSAPPRLPRPASPRLRHRHTPTKHPPPSAPAGRRRRRRAAGNPSERQLPGWRGSPSRLLPRCELSLARFFLFYPSPLLSGRRRRRRQGDGGPLGEGGEDR